MLSSHPNVSTMLHRMRRLRFGLLCFGLFLGATLLPAQSVPAPKFDLKLVVTGDVATPLTLNASDLAKMPREHVDVAGPAGAKKPPTTASRCKRFSRRLALGSDPSCKGRLWLDTSSPKLLTDTQ